MITNNKIIKIIFLQLIWLSVCSTDAYAQQEPMYSQYMFNMLHINPAYAGNKEVDNLTFLGRNQWVGLPGAPKTASLSWDRRVDGSNVGFGTQIYYDQIGIEKTTGLQFFYSYHVPINNAVLSFGVSGGFLNYRASYTDSHPLDPGDPLFLEDVNGWLPIAGFGVLFSTEEWYAGFSVPALLHTRVNTANYINQTSFGADNHYFITGGYVLAVSPVVKLKPSVMIKAVRGAPASVDYNLNSWFNDMMCFGVSYRSKDALVGMFELKVTPQIRIGYAYDYPISELGNYNKGSHEIMLRYEFCNSEKKKVFSPRYY